MYGRPSIVSASTQQRKKEADAVEIIAISGKAQHGKDTTAGFLKSALEADGYKVQVAHYADLLKYICKQFFGWNGQKDDAGRHILQYVGTDVIRTQKPDFWVDFIISMAELFPDTGIICSSPDCRFPTRLTALRAPDLIWFICVSLGRTSQVRCPKSSRYIRQKPHLTVQRRTTGLSTMAH